MATHIIKLHRTGRMRCISSSFYKNPVLGIADSFPFRYSLLTQTTACCRRYFNETSTTFYVHNRFLYNTNRRGNGGNFRPAISFLSSTLIPNLTGRNEQVVRIRLRTGHMWLIASVWTVKGVLVLPSGHIRPPSTVCPSLTFGKPRG